MQKLRLLTQAEADDYRSFFENYQPSARTVYNFARSRFGVIAGPTGAGKDTIRNALLQASPSYITILSTTTRPPRDGETDGVQYHFRNLEFFEQGFDEQRFLQGEVVHNQQISCLDSADIDQLNDNQIGLSILIVQTEIKLRQLNRDLKTVFIIPPDFATLQQRIAAERMVDPAELDRRMEAAKAELAIALKQPAYQCVVNDDLQRALGIVRNYFEQGLRDETEDERARQTIQQILATMNGGVA